MSKIRVRAIIEIMGKPEEAVTKTLEKVLEILESRYTISSKHIGKPKVVGENIFSSFLEVECAVSEFEDLFGMVLDFGPTSIEILEPKKVEITCESIEKAMNDLILKFQEFSNKLRAMSATNVILQSKLQEQARQGGAKTPASSQPGRKKRKEIKKAKKTRK